MNWNDGTSSLLLQEQAFVTYQSPPVGKLIKNVQTWMPTGIIDVFFVISAQRKEVHHER